MKKDRESISEQARRLAPGPLHPWPWVAYTIIHPVAAWRHYKAAWRRAKRMIEADDRDRDINP